MQKPIKGMVLAGGSGSRLFPLSSVVSKQLQPVYDKPMIYYPIATLMSAGIRDIQLITTPHDLPMFERLLGSGSQWGLNLSYAVQHAPKGIAEALIIGEKFIGDSPVALILGDNIFHGELKLAEELAVFSNGAVIWGYPVDDPERYGVVEIDDHGAVLNIEEKPKHPRTNLAVPGLYIYDHTAFERAAALIPSARGELEVTDLNRSYLSDKQLKVIKLDRGVTWLDSGTHESLLDSSKFISTIEQRQGLKIACLEEIAYQLRYVDEEGLRSAIARMPDSPYRIYCESALPE
ncbi:MAG: glucose-1-phosphate thymidylyltransferase RfbA [Actinobacteria bacterium]|nr:glucose-1-phosphate thymidylyltransferase RfbA [Actinomycetota bacterium]